MPKSDAFISTIGMATSMQVASMPSITSIGLPVGNSFPVLPPTMLENSR